MWSVAEGRTLGSAEGDRGPMMPLSGVSDRPLVKYWFVNIVLNVQAPEWRPGKIHFNRARLLRRNVEREISDFLAAAELLSRFPCYVMPEPTGFFDAWRLELQTYSFSQTPVCAIAARALELWPGVAAIVIGEYAPARKPPTEGASDVIDFMAAGPYGFPVPK